MAMFKSAIPSPLKVSRIAAPSVNPLGATKVPGAPMNPITKMKMENGIPGMKKGGGVKKAAGGLVCNKCGGSHKKGGKC